MKNLKLPLLSLAACATILSSCSKDLDQNIKNNPSQEVVNGDMDYDASSADENGLIPNQYLVVLNDDVIDLGLGNLLDYKTKSKLVYEQINALLQAAGLNDIEIQNVYSNVLKGFAAKISAEDAKFIEGLDFVKYVEQDQVYKIKGTVDYVHKSSAKAMKAQSTPYGIQRVGKANGAGKRVFVLDTGVDIDHSDLNVDQNLSKSFMDPCGILSIIFGCNTEPSVEDGNGHGTHVAGTIAAKNNGQGVVGVAYDASVVAIKVLGDNGSGSTSGIVQGIDYVSSVANAGDVANMSLGGGASTSLDDAVKNAAADGILFALAAGNDSQNANNSSPARANGANIYTISAMDSNDRFASYSNFGNPPVDFCEPGSAVQSTYKNGGYATLSGTSMATPHFAGILLIKGKNFATSGTVKNDPDGNADTIARL